MEGAERAWEWRGKAAFRLCRCQVDSDFSLLAKWRFRAPEEQPFSY